MSRCHDHNSDKYDDQADKKSLLCQESVVLCRFIPSITCLRWHLRWLLRHSFKHIKYIVNHWGCPKHVHHSLYHEESKGWLFRTHRGKSHVLEVVQSLTWQQNKSYHWTQEHKEPNMVEESLEELSCREDRSDISNICILLHLVLLEVVEDRFLKNLSKSSSGFQTFFLHIFSLMLVRLTNQVCWSHTAGGSKGPWLFLSTFASLDILWLIDWGLIRVKNGRILDRSLRLILRGDSIWLVTLNVCVISFNHQVWCTQSSVIDYICLTVILTDYCMT